MRGELSVGTTSPRYVLGVPAALEDLAMTSWFREAEARLGKHAGDPRVQGR